MAPKGVRRCCGCRGCSAACSRAGCPHPATKPTKSSAGDCFSTLDTDGERARDETVKAFHDLYRKNPAEFPRRPRRRATSNCCGCPIPSTRNYSTGLSKDWASLPKFQRTRGVLRFMANVVGVLWQQRDPRPADHARPRARWSNERGPRQRALSARHRHSPP